MSDDPALARIEAALARAGDEHAPRPGWQARVLAATASPPPRRRWWLAAAPALAAAAAVVLWWTWPRGAAAPAPPAPIELALVLDRGGAVVRGSSAEVGDVMHATARGGGGFRGVWIYRNDRELIAACPGGGSCKETADAMTATVPLRVIGRYSIVVLSADVALPSPAGVLDEDLAAAAKAGARYQIEPLSVQ